MKVFISIQHQRPNSADEHDDVIYENVPPGDALVEFFEDYISSREVEAGDVFTIMIKDSS